MKRYIYTILLILFLSGCAMLDEISSMSSLKTVISGQEKFRNGNVKVTIERFESPQKDVKRYKIKDPVGYLIGFRFKLNSPLNYEGIVCVKKDGEQISFPADQHQIDNLRAFRIGYVSFGLVDSFDDLIENNQLDSIEVHFKEGKILLRFLGK